MGFSFFKNKKVKEMETRLLRQRQVYSRTNSYAHERIAGYLFYTLVEDIINRLSPRKESNIGIRALSVEKPAMIETITNNQIYDVLVSFIHGSADDRLNAYWKLYCLQKRESEE